jgi:hypothetical protein
MFKFNTAMHVLDTYINDIMDANRDILDRETVRKVDASIHTYQNYINLLVGKQGLGKTFTVLREIIKISFVDPCLHLIIIINKEGSPNDATWDVLKPVFRKPVISYLSYNNAEQVVRNILLYKDLYNTIKLEHLENKIEHSQVNEICNTLYIDGFDAPYLNTVLYFEDSANNILFKKPTQYFPQLVAKCRHNGLIMFFSTQFWKGLPTELKANATTIYIFRAFSNQQLQNHERLVLDTVKGTITHDKS